MNEELHWQPMASMDLDLDREQPPHLWISGAGRRPRALGYAAQAIRESTPRDRRPKTAWLWVYKAAGCGASGTPCLRPRLWGQCQNPV